MFSAEERVIFQKNQLMEVICQFRFPEILAIEAKSPADFQDAIREDYPVYRLTKEVQQPRVTGTPGAFRLEEQKPTVNHQFSTSDGILRVNLTSKFIALSALTYDRWENFAGRLDKLLSAFIRVYSPAYFERVGLRFVNAVCRSKLDLEETPFRELVQDCYLGLLAEPDVNERTTSRSSMDTELALMGGCMAKIHAGPGMVRKVGEEASKEPRFIFDQDLFMKGNVPVNLSAASLNTLHLQADSIFRGAITQTLYDAMEPTEP